MNVMGTWRFYRYFRVFQDHTSRTSIVLVENRKPSGGDGLYPSLKEMTGTFWAVMADIHQRLVISRICSACAAQMPTTGAPCQMCAKQQMNCGCRGKVVEVKGAGYFSVRCPLSSISTSCLRGFRFPESVFIDWGGLHGYWSKPCLKENRPE